MAEHDKLLGEGPREAPEPQTAEERSRTRRRKAVFTAGGLTSLLLVVLLHVVGFIPTIGGALVLMIALALFGLSIYRFVSRVGAPSRRTPSPVRGLVLAFAAITVAAFVLAWLSGFQPGDWIVVAVPAGILVCLWLLDRGLVRLRGAS